MEVLTPIVLAGGGTGGGGTPGGSDTQVQFNDGGAFGGDAGLTYDATNGSLSVGGKTITTDEPVVDLSQTWNNAATAFTGLKLNVTNTASAGGSNLLDLQLGGATQARISSAGYLFSTGILSAAPGTTNWEIATGPAYGVTLRNTQKLAWSSGFATIPADLSLYRDAADTLAQRRGTNAQTYRLYNTYTDASNYERGFFQWNSNVLEIGSEGAGTGSEQPVRITAATLKLPNLPTYADNTAATSGGLVAGDVYKTATGELRITV